MSSKEGFHRPGITLDYCEDFSNGKPRRSAVSHKREDIDGDHVLRKALHDHDDHRREVAGMTVSKKLTQYASPQSREAEITKSGASKPKRKR